MTVGILVTTSVAVELGITRFECPGLRLYRMWAYHRNEGERKPAITNKIKTLFPSAPGRALHVHPTILSLGHVPGCYPVTLLWGSPCECSHRNQRTSVKTRHLSTETSPACRPWCALSCFYSSDRNVWHLYVTEAQYSPINMAHRTQAARPLFASCMLVSHQGVFKTLHSLTVNYDISASIYHSPVPQRFHPALYLCRTARRIEFQRSTPHFNLIMKIIAEY